VARFSEHILAPQRSCNDETFLAAAADPQTDRGL